MHTLLKIGLGLLLALFLLLLALPILGVWALGPDVLGQVWPTITIDGEVVPPPVIGAADWAVGALVGLVLLFVMVVVVPGALFTALLCVACGLLFAALLVGGVFALLLAPIALPVLLAWWLLRRRQRRTMPA